MNSNKTLKLSRKEQQAVVIQVPASLVPTEFRVIFAGTRGKTGHIVFDAPEQVKVIREEIINRV